LFHFGLGLEGYFQHFAYAGAICIFLLSVLWRPDVGLYYLALLLPLQTWRYRLHGFFLGELLIDFLLLGIILGLVIHNRGRVFTRTPWNRLLLLFAAYHYISLWMGTFYLGADLPLWFDDRRLSDWKNYMVMPLICLVTISAIKNTRQMKILILVMSLSTLLVNKSIYGVMSGRDLSTFSYGLRYAGPLGYAGENGLAAFASQTALLLLGLYAFEKRLFWKLALLGVVASSLYSLLFSFSRGGYIGFLGGLFFLGVFKERKLLVVIACVLIGWQTLLPTSVQQRVSMTYDESGALESSAADRVLLWEDAAQLFQNQPIWGTGLETYEYMHRLGAYTDTHNYYLKVLVEMGLIGLFLLVWLLKNAFSAGWQLFRSAEDDFLKSLGLGVAAMILCAAIVNFFGDRWVRLQVNGFLWALVGCAVRGQLLTWEQQARVAKEEIATFSPGSAPAGSDEVVAACT
jgi:O-antigen ligase